MKKVELLIKKFVTDIDEKKVDELFATQAFGKMLRARLALSIAGETEPARLLAAIVESIHFASLLHDDVIDDAPLRRNKPSVNAQEGAKVAVMMGDIFYSKAFFELTKLGSDVAQIVSFAVLSLSKGEMQDVFLSKHFNESRELYERMIYLKTASLIEAVCEAAAVLSGKNRQNYKDYGRNLGLCFQIVDDILDLTQDEKTLGKPAFADFTEGKTTLPFIFLHEDLSAGDKERLRSLFKKPLSADERAWIKQKMQENGSIEKAYGVAADLASRAKALAGGNFVLEAAIDKALNRKF